MAELIDKKAITESRDILDELELFELTPYISAENLIKFVDNLPSVTEAEIRAKAIDEFAEKLSTDVESLVAIVNGIEADLLTLDYFDEFIFDVAEQLKEE